jgi:hypothetical protein
VSGLLGFSAAALCVVYVMSFWGRSMAWQPQPRLAVPDADRLNYVFVTVDTGHGAVDAYLSSFDKQIRGYTGAPAEIGQIAKEYRVYYQKVPTVRRDTLRWRPIGSRPFGGIDRQRTAKHSKAAGVWEPTASPRHPRTVRLPQPPRWDRCKFMPTTSSLPSALSRV